MQDLGTAASDLLFMFNSGRRSATATSGLMNKSEKVAELTA